MNRRTALAGSFALALAAGLSRFFPVGAKPEVKEGEFLPYEQACVATMSYIVKDGHWHGLIKLDGVKIRWTKPDSWSWSGVTVKEE